ncbi:MAG: hypothetical protein Q7P63_02810 [Verrucomicrobiota bacterium JB022]|nr:hypothetical protein [Verrucomicrobiota bacterium JB022]
MTWVVYKRPQADIEAERRALESFAKKATASPEAARAALLKGGFITKDGKLAKKYR